MNILRTVIAAAAAVIGVTITAVPTALAAGRPAMSAAVSATMGYSGRARFHPRAVAHRAPTIACPPASSSVISYAPGAGRTVALTFDDGPGPYTAPILDVLRQEGAKATFYDTGAHVRTRGALEKRAVAEGNVIGNHTYSHRHLTTLPLAGQSNEMDLASNAIRAAAGVSTCTFRPPYGSYNSSTLAAARARRMSVVTWSVDTEDWKQSAQLSPYWTNRIITRAEADARLTHPLILFHAGKASPEPESKVTSERPNTVAALPLVIDFYKSHGYTFVVLGR